MRLTSLAAILLLTAACSRDIGAPGDFTARGIEMVATVQSHTSAGDSVTIRISNAGAQTEFFSRCGDGPLLLLQTFIDGQWTGGVQNFMCIAPSAPGPVRLAPGESVTIVRVFDVAGRYRFTTPAGEREDLSDATLAASNAFDIP